MSRMTARVAIAGTFSMPSFFRPPALTTSRAGQTVVVDAVDADVAEPVELRADADPADDDVVVVVGLRLAQRAAVFLAGCRHRQRERARRERRRLAVGLDAHADRLAALDQLGRLRHVGGGDVVDRAHLIVGAPFGLVAGLDRLRLCAGRHRHRQTERQDTHGNSHRGLLFLVAPSGARQSSARTSRPLEGRRVCDFRSPGSRGAGERPVAQVSRQSFQNRTTAGAAPSVCSSFADRDPMQ